jgi:hypothetical protein
MSPQEVEMTRICLDSIMAHDERSIRTYDLYAAPTSDLKAVRELVENIFSIRMHVSDSEWHVPAYWYRTSNDEHIGIQENYDIREDDYAEPAYPEHALLLLIDDFNENEAARIRETLEANGFTLLRHDMQPW